MDNSQKSSKEISKEELRSRLRGRLDISRMTRLPKEQKQQNFEKLQNEVKGLLEKMKSQQN